jgi:hypothetical protein
VGGKAKRQVQSHIKKDRIVGKKKKKKEEDQRRKE